jgi:peptidoglycan/xylan/chitin deacetylase (PgdA/CDA1 family)
MHAVHRAVPVVVFAATVGLVIAAATGTARTKGLKDPADADGPLDIQRVQIAQSGPRLSVRIQTYGGWEASRLEANPSLDASSPESYLCLELAQDERWSRTCLSKSGGRKRLSLMKLGSNGTATSKRSLEAKISRGGSRSFRATFKARAARLRAGRFGWRAISGWGDPSCAPPPPSPTSSKDNPRRRSSGDAGPSRATPAVQCMDEVPDGGDFVQAKLRRPHIVGCTHGGPLVRYRGNEDRKQVALTFDDGPSAFTSSVIRILDKQRAKGTFFVVGQEIPGRQEVLQSALRHGHELGNHTMHHGVLPPTSDLAAASSLIRRATGFTPCTFRPPAGVINLAVARGARSLGMTTVVWNVDTRDWTGLGSSQIKARATAVGRGSIVLMHDGGGNRSPTVAALPSIISELKRRGFELVTVTRLLGNRMIWRP